MVGVLERLRAVSLSHAAMPSPAARAEAPKPRVKASLGVATVSGATGIIASSTFSWAAGAIYDRATAMRIPTIARARNVHVEVISVLPLRYWKRTPIFDAAGNEQPDQQLDPQDWMLRPDPNETLAFTLGWTVDDLFFYERAFWEVTDRSTAGFPSAFRWMPFCECEPVYSDDLLSLQSLRWRNRLVPMENVVEFKGTVAGVLNIGSDAITTALKGERAAQRFADFNLPAGTINIPLPEGYDAHTTAQLNEIGDNFDTRRSSSATAVLEGATYENPDWDATKMALVESRQHSALDCSRISNVPPWLTGAPQGATMTYQNAAQARRDLVDFGSSGYMAVITQTLSGPNVTPAGTYLDFDVEGWLALAADLSPAGGVVPTKPVQP